jgi:hypothetical protein
MSQLSQYQVRAKDHWASSRQKFLQTRQDYFLTIENTGGLIKNLGMLLDVKILDVIIWCLRLQVRESMLSSIGPMMMCTWYCTLGSLFVQYVDGCSLQYGIYSV